MATGVPQADHAPRSPGAAATRVSTTAISAFLNLIFSGITIQIKVFAGFYYHFLVNRFFHINERERNCQQTYHLFY